MSDSAVIWQSLGLLLPGAAHQQQHQGKSDSNVTKHLHIFMPSHASSAPHDLSPPGQREKAHSVACKPLSLRVIRRRLCTQLRPPHAGPFSWHPKPLILWHLWRGNRKPSEQGDCLLMGTWVSLLNIGVLRSPSCALSSRVLGLTFRIYYKPQCTCTGPGILHLRRPSRKVPRHPRGGREPWCCPLGTEAHVRSGETWAALLPSFLRHSRLTSRRSCYRPQRAPPGNGKNASNVYCPAPTDSPENPEMIILQVSQP